jgi:N-acetylneuraminate synthase
VFVIGEIGVNHNGKLDLARRLIDLAAEAGADAVKFQTFTAERLVTASAARAEYQTRNDPHGGQSQLAMLKALELHPDDLLKARDHTLKAGLRFLSTPFDEDAADLLADLGVQAFKVSSGDLTHLPFLRHLAAKRLPIILSTGMANLAEVEEAVCTVEAAGNPPLAILHCVSQYPCAPADCNLRAMTTLRAAFGRPVGWSDHTEGDAITLAAVALGAEILEKHFTLDQNLPGPDHRASLPPDAFKAMLHNIRSVEAAFGDGRKRPVAAEADTARVARRSIVAARDLPVGTVLSPADLAYRRPGTGLHPREAQTLIGRRLRRALNRDATVTWTDVSPPVNAP